MTAAFDTLVAARELEAAGMDRVQAEAVAETCREAASAGGDVATKADLAAAIAPLATKAELAAAIAPLATKAELSALETRLTWRMVGVVAGVNGAFAALIVGLLVAVLDRLP